MAKAASNPEAADDAAGKIERQKAIAAESLLHFPAEDVNHPAVQHQMQQSTVHELVGQQLPHKPMAQALNAQSKVVALRNREVGTVIDQFENKGRHIQHQQ